MAGTKDLKNNPGKSTNIILIILTVQFLVSVLSCHSPANEPAPSENDVASTLYQTGIDHYKLNRYSEAKESLSKAVEAAIASNDTLTWAKSLQVLGSVALTLGDDHLALKLNYEALPLFEKVGDKEGIARVYNILGLYKSGQEEYDSAIGYYNRALAINQEINSIKGIIHNKGNLGYLYEKTGRLEEAEKLYIEAEQLMISSGDSLNLPVIYSDLASVNGKRNHTGEAVRFLVKAAGICENTKDTAMLASVCGNLGELYITTRQYDSAEYFLEKSIYCSKAINDPEIEMHALNFLIRIDTLNGDYREASRKFQHVLILQDSAYSIKSRNNLKASELQYENQKKNLLIESQELQLKSVKKLNRLYLSLFIISALASTLVLISIFLLFKNNRKNRELLRNEIRIRDLEIQNSKKSEEIQELKIKSIEEEMKIKEREQVSHALALEQKNELLNMINNKINAAMEDTGILHIQDLNGLVSSIRMQISDSTESDLFNQKFNKVHSAFYSNLTKAHPDLTKSELKFCAYLKLNLTSHQISTIMNVTGEAIRKNRHRIRKKLQLDKGDSLENYLSAF